MFTAVTVNNVSKQFRSSELPLRSTARLNGHASVRLDQNPGQPGTVSVRQITFSIAAGEIFGLVGPSSSGKTALIRMLAGQLLPDEGEIRVFGCDVAHQSAQVARLTNRVSVEASLFRKLSALDNLLVGAQQFGLGGAELRRQGRELLARLGFDDWAIQAPLQALPRYLHQKVTIARALISRPRLLLLDNPLRDLRPSEKQAVLQVIAQQRDAYGTTIVIATREWLEAAHICDRIGLLEDGRLISVDALHESLPLPGPWPFVTQSAEVNS